MKIHSLYLFAGLFFIFGLSQSAAFGMNSTQYNFTHLENNDNYEISFSWPTQTPWFKKVSPEVDKKIRTTIKDWVDGEIKGFKEENDNIDIAEIPIQPKSQLLVTYKRYITPEYLSYRFDIYDYGAGAAHGMDYFKTFTFNKRGEVLELSYFFKENSKYLQRISEIALKKISNQLKRRGHYEDLLYEEGVGPKSENFGQFFFTKNALHILFPPYQVASYADGSFNIAIPYKNLKGVLK